MHAFQKPATLQKLVEKVTNLVATEARFTTMHIAKCVGISVGAAHTILRRDLKMKRISARWIPHLLTKEQELALVKIAKQLLKQFPEYNNRSFSNIITGDETWVHFYEPKRKIQNKIWATKGGKRLCITKRTMSIKKVMYVIFFTNQSPAIQIAVPKGKSVNARFYKGKVLHKFKKYFLNRRPATGLPRCQVVARQCFVTQSVHSTRISETGKGCRGSAPFLFTRYCPFRLFPIPEPQKTPRWKKMSNTQ